MDSQTQADHIGDCWTTLASTSIEGGISVVIQHQLSSWSHSPTGIAHMIYDLAFSHLCTLTLQLVYTPY